MRMKRMVQLTLAMLIVLQVGIACDSGSGGDRHGLNEEEYNAFLYTNYARTDPSGFAEEFLLEAYQGGRDNGAYLDLKGRQPVSALELHKALIAASRAHSRDMDENCKTLQHDSCDGTLWSTRIRSYYDGNRIAENVGWGFHTGLSVVVAWITSPGHRNNLLSPDYEHVGFGQAGTYWTQNFGSGGK